MRLEQGLGDIGKLGVSGRDQAENGTRLEEAEQLPGLTSLVTCLSRHRALASLPLTCTDWGDPTGFAQRLLPAAWV